jgi:hypothetical protein
MPASKATASFGGAVATLCLLYLMLRPVSSNEILVPVLGVLGVTSAALVVRLRRRVSELLVPVVALLAIVAALGIVTGVNNPGWAFALVTWVAGPLVFGCWAVALHPGLLRLTLIGAAWGTTALSCFIVLYVGAQSGMLPSIIPRALLEETGAGFDGTGSASVIRLYGLSTLAAAAPMWTASLFVGAHPWLPGLLPRIAAAATAVSAVMLGGRRAIVLVVLLTPLLVWLLSTLTAPGHRLRVPRAAAVAGVLSLPLAALVVPRLLEQPAVQRAVQALSDFFSPDQAARGIGVRADQSRILLEEAAGSPVIGHGFGAVVDSGYARNGVRPWEFELQYHLLAFQVGALGLALLAIAVLLALLAMRRAAILDPTSTPVLIVTATAAIGMLIANASNPYLQAPGHMWTIALALGAVNTVLTQGPTPAPAPALLRPTVASGLSSDRGSWLR